MLLGEIDCQFGAFCNETFPCINAVKVNHLMKRGVS